MILYLIGLVLLLVIAALAASYQSKIRNTALTFFANSGLLVNIAHKGEFTAFPDVAIPFRYAVVKRGIAYNTVALANTGDVPIAILKDMTPTTDTDLTYPIHGTYLGMNVDTERAIAHGAITQGDLLTPYNGAYVQTVAGIGAGTYWIVGRSNTTTVNGTNDQVEIIPCFPYAVTIA